MSSSRIKEFFDPRRPLRGDAYALIGFIAFAIKFMVDSAIAQSLFHRRWNLMDYWFPRLNAFYLADAAQQEPAFALSLLLASIPFMVFGFLMTRRRLAALELPIWLSGLFFVPLLNLPFFALITLSTKEFFKPEPTLPSKPSGESWPWMPSSALGSAVTAVVVTAVGTLLLMKFNVGTYRKYGFTLFFVMPFIQGLLAAWLYGHHRPRSLGASQLVGIISCCLAAALSLAMAIEGVICLLMAAPLWLAMAAMGAWVGWEMRSGRWRSPSASTPLFLIVASLPVLMGAEYQAGLKDPLISVRSSMIIQAPPSMVWKHVVSFAELPPPEEWFFKAGIAYPMRAKIFGKGRGAMRHCIFSTGPFIEPIKIWDAPRLLRFGVTSCPAPMSELSPYKRLDPPHLHGYLVSKEGQFELQELPDGSTRLEGTTWYQHHLQPARYWQFWSDFIIHRIHFRVLNHIKMLAETETRKGTNHG